MSFLNAKGLFEIRMMIHFHLDLNQSLTRKCPRPFYEILRVCLTPKGLACGILQHRNFEHVCVIRDFHILVLNFNRCGQGIKDIWKYESKVMV